MNPSWYRRTIASAIAATATTAIGASASVALPPPDDIPEEVLRNQIILEGRSLLDGRPLSPVEYLAEVEALGTPAQPRLLRSDVRQLIFLLQIYGRLIRPFVPFL